MSQGSHDLPIGRIVVFFFSCSFLLLAQSNTGELRLRVTDPSGLAVRTSIQIVSEANQHRRNLSTDDQGSLTLQCLVGASEYMSYRGRPCHK